MKARLPLRDRSILFSLLLILVTALGFTWPWEVGDPWPKSSDHPVAILDHPTVESRAAELSGGPDGGYRFAVFGDQRALADGEWQDLLEQIAAEARDDDRFLFVLDTGDMVYDGSHSDQFRMLAEILSPVEAYPYLVGVGNHEKDNNEDRGAIENTTRFLAYLDPGFSADRMYYEKEIGPVRFLFLDTNDLVYGDEGERDEATPPEPGSRAEAQLQWLVERLAKPPPGENGAVVVVMHHPIVQSSKKHRPQARSLWNLFYQGKSLADHFLDSGVSLVLSGHTHTYERFRIERSDGASFHHVNTSGRPRTDIFWYGDGARRARDIAGREAEWLDEKGWGDLDRWTFVQEDAMTDDAANQFLLFHVDAGGGIRFEPFFLDDDAPGGLRRGATIPIR